jgi:hypothetical protein
MTALDELAIPSLLRREHDISRQSSFAFFSRYLSIHLIDYLFSPPLPRLAGGQFQGFYERMAPVGCLLIS